MNLQTRDVDLARRFHRCPSVIDLDLQLHRFTHNDFRARHPCRNFPPVTVTALDSLPILPDLAKDLNLSPDSALVIPRHPADLSFFDQAVSVRGRDSVMGKAVPAVYRACPSSADPSDSRDS